MTWLKIFQCILFLFLVQSCTQPSNTINSNYRDSFFQLLKKGDEVYAAKNNLRSFETSLKFYDKAQELANKSNDTMLIAEAVFAKGRVYDAWNKDPLLTINYFKEAARLFALMPGSRKRYLYVKHLVAHAYDKAHDSVNTVIVLKELFKEISKLDTAVQKQLPFTAEMALISTEVKNYDLAEAILKNITSSSWIKNDPKTYDYLNHYYLTQSRIDIYKKHLIHSPYTDTLKSVLFNAVNIFDKMYYSQNLSELSATTGDFETAFKMLGIFKGYSDSINNSNGINSMQNVLLKSELITEKRLVEYQERARKTRINIIWLLSTLLAVITVLTIYFQKQKKEYRAKTRELAEVNKMLDDQFHQVEVLNKEIQHRVKNNLQMISSLLQMQERKSVNKETTNNLHAAMLRIESIASLNNELLQNNKDPDFTKHIKQVVTAAINCLGSDRNVVTHINIESFLIQQKQYLPVSLIINEWVTNSIKYAKTVNGFLELNIIIKRTDDNIKVQFSDNGTVQKKYPEGLGTQIITMLCRQISGNLLTLNNNPYHYELTLAH